MLCAGSPRGRPLSELHGCPSDAEVGGSGLVQSQVIKESFHIIISSCLLLESVFHELFLYVFFRLQGPLFIFKHLLFLGVHTQVRWSNSRLTKVADRNSHRWCFSLVIYCVYIYIQNAYSGCSIRAEAQALQDAGDSAASSASNQLHDLKVLRSALHRFDGILLAVLFHCSISRLPSIFYYIPVQVS